MDIKNLHRKIQDFNENLTMFEEHFIIIPYRPSGYVGQSNYGSLSDQRDIEDFETYKRVWTGNDSFEVFWKDSVFHTNSEKDPKIQYNYQLGDFFAGWMEQNASNVDIDTDTSFSDYKSQTTEKTLTFRVNAEEFHLTTNYEFYFYKVPEIYGNILFRVESLEREYLGKDLMCYVLTLKSLNQELANTGRAVQQNVRPNAPGQGYWDAAVVNEKPENVDYKEFYGRYIVADKKEQIHNPCKKIVFKAYGNAYVSNIALVGRRIRRGGNVKDFGIPTFVFPMNFTQASTPTLYRTQSEQSNYYWVRNLAPVIQFDKEAMTALKETLSMSHVWPSEGFVQINGGGVDGVNEMKNTNPLTGNSFTEQLFGKVVIEEKEVPGGNPDKIKVRVHKPWQVQVKSADYKTDMIYGCSQTFNDSGTYPIHDVMFHAFWRQKNMKTLPINHWNTLDFGWTVSTSISMAKSQMFLGSFLLLGVGIAATLKQVITAPKFQGFSGLVPASLMDFMVAECSSIFGAGKPDKDNNYFGKVKLSYFAGNENNEIANFFNTQTMNTSFEADLTDLFEYKYDGTNTKILNTTTIGQTTYEDGTNILPTGKPVLLNGSEKLVAIEDNFEGFIIDDIYIQALFKGDFSIEFLDFNGDVIWSGTYQSQGKWSDSIREINTHIKTSIYGRENMFLAQELPWPKEPAELDIIDVPNPDIVKQYAVGEIGLKKVYENTGTSISIVKVFNDYFDMEATYLGEYQLAFRRKKQDPFYEKDVVIVDNYAATLEDFITNYPIAKIDFCVFNVQGLEVFVGTQTAKFERNKYSVGWISNAASNNGIVNINEKRTSTARPPKPMNDEITSYRFAETATWVWEVRIYKDVFSIKMNIKIYYPSVSTLVVFRHSDTQPFKNVQYLGDPNYREYVPGFYSHYRRTHFLKDRSANSSVSFGAFIKKIVMTTDK